MPCVCMCECVGPITRVNSPAEMVRRPQGQLARAQGKEAHTRGERGGLSMHSETKKVRMEYVKQCKVKMFEYNL